MNSTELFTRTDKECIDQFYIGYILYLEFTINNYRFQKTENILDKLTHENYISILYNCTEENYNNLLFDLYHMNRIQLKTFLVKLLKDSRSVYKSLLLSDTVPISN